MVRVTEQIPHVRDTTAIATGADSGAALALARIDLPRTAIGAA